MVLGLEWKSRLGLLLVYIKVETSCKELKNRTYQISDIWMSIVYLRSNRLKTCNFANVNSIYIYRKRHILQNSNVKYTCKKVHDSAFQKI